MRCAMNITKLEYAMLNKIAHDEHQPTNTATPKSFEDTDAIWASGIVETPEDKGIFTSLLKKGLVGFQEEIDKDWRGKKVVNNMCWLTIDGYNAWVEKRAELGS